MTPDQLFKQFTDGFSDRKFSAGLLVAFIDFFVSLDTPGQQLHSFDEFLTSYPRQERTTAGLETFLEAASREWQARRPGAAEAADVAPIEALDPDSANQPG